MIAAGRSRESVGDRRSAVGCWFERSVGRQLGHSYRSA
jgi:hypothetical protein